MSMTQWDSQLVSPVSEDRDHVIGAPDAPITLVEYGDYECPFCAAAHPIVKRARAAMGDDLRFAFRHFPISTMHPHAETAAEAAEAAGAQDRFWEMHDLLFTNQDLLDPRGLAQLATTLGLDLDRFSRELSTHAHAERVREDFMTGVRSGVNGTPTFFINGIRHDGAWDLPSFLTALKDATLAASGEGVSR